MSEDGPLASVRLENIRFGFEDRALISLLGGGARSTAGVLVRGAANYTFNATLLDATRARVARAVGPRDVACNHLL